MTRDLRLDHRWFNPLYYHLRQYVETPTLKRILIFGGKSASKTFSVGQLFSVFAYTRSNSAIAYRKEQTTIRTTLKPTFDKAVELMHLENVTPSLDFKIETTRGGQIIFKGMDDEGKVKGIEGFKY